MARVRVSCGATWPSGLVSRETKRASLGVGARVRPRPPCCPTPALKSERSCTSGERWQRRPARSAAARRPRSPINGSAGRRSTSTTPPLASPPPRRRSRPATRRVRATGLDGGLKGGGGNAYAGRLVGARRSAQLWRRLRPSFRVDRSLGIYSLTLYGGSPSTVREKYPEGAPWVILSYFMHRDRRSIRSRE